MTLENYLKTKRYVSNKQMLSFFLSLLLFYFLHSDRLFVNATKHRIDIVSNCSNVICSCSRNLCTNSSNSYFIPHCPRNACYPIQMVCSFSDNEEGQFTKQLNATDNIKITLFIYCFKNDSWSNGSNHPPIIDVTIPMSPYPPIYILPPEPSPDAAPSPINPIEPIEPEPSPDAAPIPINTVEPIEPKPSPDAAPIPFNPVEPIDPKSSPDSAPIEPSPKPIKPIPICQTDPLCKNCLVQNNPLYYSQNNTVLSVCSKCLNVSNEVKAACFNCLSWARPGNGDGEYCTKCSSDTLFYNDCFDCTVNLDGFCTRERSCFDPPKTFLNGTAFVVSVEERRACWDCMAKHRFYKWNKFSCGGMVNSNGFNPFPV